ncbi:MAG: neutral/alkaline non-lysosomal ceramidase N-terminal domain-containing protein [Verrucomicrobiota bacterium]
MYPSPARVLAVLLLCGCTFGCAGKHNKPPENNLRAAVVETDITAPVGYRMAGYFEERLSTGVHDPLKAKAIILQQGSEKIAFVFCDLIGISLDVSTKARQRASEKTKIPFKNILIAATHSHTGPLFDDTRAKYFHQAAVDQFGRDPRETIDYSGFLEKKVVDLICEANEKLEPAGVEVFIAPQDGLAFNRRYHMKNGKVVFNPGQLNPNIERPAGPTDPTVSVLLLRDRHRALRGGLTVFAMHPDTVGGTLYSADYPYYLQETLRQNLETNYVSAFAVGPCGDLNHIKVAVKEQVKGLEVAQRLGITLGKTVLAQIQNAEALKNPEFAVRSETNLVPFQTITPALLADARKKISTLDDPRADFMAKVEAVKTLDLADKGSSWPMEVQVFRLDSETAIVGLPCEIFVELGLAIKAASPFKKTIVMSICNDRPSYVPTKKAFAEGSYEVTNARVKPGVGETLVDTAVKLLREIKP